MCGGSDFSFRSHLAPLCGVHQSHRTPGGLAPRSRRDGNLAGRNYRRATLHGINVGCGIWLQWRSKHRKDTNAFNLPFDGPGTFKVKLVRTGVRIFMYIGKDGSEPKEIAHFR
jgi:hypothetical protein